MIPATQEQIEAACMTRDADAAARHLRQHGLVATRRQCRATVKVLVATGDRKRFLTDDRIRLADRTSRFDAAMGCKRLLSRHLKYGQHCISDPVQMASALREAGMVRA